MELLQIEKIEELDEEVKTLLHKFIDSYFRCELDKYEKQKLRDLSTILNDVLNSYKITDIISKGHIDLAEWLLQNDTLAKYANLRDIIHKIAGNKVILDWMIPTYYNTDYINEYAVCDICMYGNLECLKWFIEKFPDVRIESNNVEVATRNVGDLEFIKFLANLKYMKINHEMVFSDALDYDKLEIAKWIYENYEIKQQTIDRELCIFLTRPLKTIQWLVSIGGKFDEKIWILFINNDRLDVAKWMISEKIISYEKCTELVCGFGGFSNFGENNLAKWLFKKYLPSSYDFNLAFSNQYFEVAKIIWERLNGDVDDILSKEVIYTNNIYRLDTLKWILAIKDKYGIILDLDDLIEQHIRFTDNSIIKWAIKHVYINDHLLERMFKYGNLEIIKLCVKLIKESGREFKIQSRTFHSACISGDINKIKYLLEFNKENGDSDIITTELIENLLDNSSIDKAYWLWKIWKNRQDIKMQNTTLKVDMYAIQNIIVKHKKYAKWLISVVGNINKIFKYMCIWSDIYESNWILENYNIDTKTFTDVLFDSCRSDKINLTRWILHMNVIDNNSIQVAFQYVCEYGYVQIAELLYNAGGKLNENTQYAFRKSCLDGNLPMAKWLWEKSNKTLDMNFRYNVDETYTDINIFKVAEWMWNESEGKVNLYDNWFL